MNLELPDSGREHKPSEAQLVAVTELIPGLDARKLPRDASIARRTLEKGGEPHWPSQIWWPKGTPRESSNKPFVGGIVELLRIHKELQPQVFNRLREEFQRKVIVDIGPGRTYDNYHLARILGASAYVAVEPYFAHLLEENLTTTLQEDIAHGNEHFAFAQGAPHIPFAIVPEDALSFLKRIPDNAVCVMSTGTDRAIFHGREEYVRKVVRQMKRVLGKSGAGIFYRTVFGDEFRKNKKDFDRLMLGGEEVSYAPPGAKKPPVHIEQVYAVKAW